ncbi:MAG: HEAT repeat domain-containing protein, partial [Anaerolineae bacterium]|nr:HEAT repeat domain-containing protein [Anaerolineae bacterium]
GDGDPEIRIVSIRLLQDEESPGLENVLLNLLENDMDERVRAGAGGALGQFIYQGELEEIPEETLKVIEEQLLRTVNGKDRSIVRRKALEALGYSSRPEVIGMIEHAFSSSDGDWVASALLAMGRSADIRWVGDVLKMLDEDDSSIRMEATRAAGELDIKRAGPKLIELLDDSDDDVRAAAIWSLSQIGGEGVSEALEELMDENPDEKEVALLEEALDNLAFNEGFGSFDLLEYDEDDLGDLNEFDVDFDDEDV